MVFIGYPQSLLFAFETTFKYNKSIFERSLKVKL